MMRGADSGGQVPTDGDSGGRCREEWTTTEVDAGFEKL
jgi:hypothetical protein